VTKRKRYGPDVELADVFFQATLRQYAPLTADDIRGLTPSEIRQLWLKRREQASVSERKYQPSKRKQWALNKIKELREEEDKTEGLPGELLVLWEKEFGKVSETRRENLMRTFRRWVSEA
jgi:hypothetical protein